MGMDGVRMALEMKHGVSIFAVDGSRNLLGSLSRQQNRTVID